MPKFNNQIIASRPQHPVLRIELYHRNEVLMCIDLLLLLAEVEVPDPYCLVIGGRI